jgi:hypothetical protein
LRAIVRIDAASAWPAIVVGAALLLHGALLLVRGGSARAFIKRRGLLPALLRIGRAHLAVFVVATAGAAHGHLWVAWIIVAALHATFAAAFLIAPAFAEGDRIRSIELAIRSASPDRDRAAIRKQVLRTRLTGLYVVGLAGLWAWSWELLPVAR